MPGPRKLLLLPSGLKYQLAVAFCLMSLFPLLVGTYIASLFIEYPFTSHPENLIKIALVMSFSIVLSFLGYRITQQFVPSILNARSLASKIARGEPVDSESTTGAGPAEVEELCRSLQTISKNARVLLEQVEKFSMQDKLTGLYNAAYIRQRLNEEIQRAIHYQRPCSFAYFMMNHFEAYAFKNGQETAQDVLKEVAGVLNTHLSEFDRAARVSMHEFALIFPDKNKKKAIEIVEDVLKKTEELFSKKGSNARSLSFCVGISENPIDGVTADELYAKALGRAKFIKTQGIKLVEAFA